MASNREPGQIGNTEWLARRAAASLPADSQQTWKRLAGLQLPEFVDQRHTVGSYPWPQGAARDLLDATMACTDLVLVAPVYWFSFPSTLKTYLDHWSAWMRIEGLPFKEEMAKKRLYLITTSGDRAKAQPMIDSTQLCARFLAMEFGGTLWGKGGPPDAVQSDLTALASAEMFFKRAAA
ncbi:NAD(P)H-dependent oxidoreductase [Rhodoferax sp.]|uniref:flavodoxin family protein n=1 Tax=Rhodoferax sp. TaxID=50421 RepID=UPI0026077457|nr:NAD(P)H-dependent oxidoreductase [Rhodoferax sp.]MDD2926983.1 NAD(P)H-dependent oxidoreductase [Rhodoferax sp.]